MDLDDESKRVVDRVVVALALGTALANTVLIFTPGGWHMKVTHIWAFDVGLHDVDINDKTLGGYVFKKLMSVVFRVAGGSNRTKGEMWGHKFAEIMSPGSHPIEYVANQLCNIQMLVPVVNNCQMWMQMQYGGWTMLIGLVGTNVGLAIGAVMLLGGKTRCLKLTAFACFAGAAFVNVGCLGAYAALTFNFGIWLSDLQLSHPGITFSTCSVACVLLTCVTCMLPALVFFCSGIPKKYKDDEEFYDSQGYPTDQYGNPLPVDEYGNPVPVDQYGAPVGGPPPPGAYDPNMSAAGGYDPNTQGGYGQGGYDAYGAGGGGGGAYPQPGYDPNQAQYYQGQGGPGPQSY